MSYFLFFSYSAGDDPDVTRHKRQFYDDLVVSIQKHRDFRLEAGKLGFLDADMSPGADWGDELGRALRTCNVFVYLQEQAYFNFKERPWCGREWHVFRRRVEQHWNTLSSGVERTALMIPVLWQLLPKLPEVVGKFQFKSRSLGEEYAQLGLFALKSRPENSRNYTTFVSNLAHHVVSYAREHQLPALDALPHYQDIADPFAAPIPLPVNTQPLVNGGPRRVEFVYVVAGKDKLQGLRNQFDAYADDGDPILWRPFFPPTDDTVVNLAEMLAHKKKLAPSRIAFGSDLIQRLTEAQKARKIVVLITDPWSLRVPEFRAVMEQYSGMNFWNCVVVVPWNEDQETRAQAAALDDLVQEVFFGLPDNAVRSQIRSSKEFVRQLEKAFLAAREKIERFAKFRKVDGPGSRTVPSFS